jgi:hypothetical protein
MKDSIHLSLRVTGLACAVSLLGLVGCGSAASATNSASNGGGGGAGPAGATSLTFSPTSTLTTDPGEIHVLKVVAKPPAGYHISFALLGDPKDASLDRSEVNASPSGVATVQLSAPTSATTFSVRASIGTHVSAIQAVSVSSSFGTLLVMPSYSGKRAVWQWTATARTGKTCADLSGTPPPDGDLIATAEVGSTPTIQDVPVGRALAVTLRAGYYIGGCADVQQVSANGDTTVIVPVSDRPIQLGSTDLDVALNIEQPSDGWQGAVQDAVQLTTNAMLGGDQDDVDALLAAMYASTDPGAASAFQAARVAGDWDETLRDLLGQTAATSVIRNQAKAWLEAGAAALSGASVFKGHLSTSGTPVQPVFQLNQVAGVDAAGAGATSLPSATTWSADAGDTVLLGTTLYWMPSKLLTALALSPAQTEEPNATSVPDALAQALSCQSIAQALEQQSSIPGAVFSGCDATCAETLCDKALDTMWQRAETASADVNAPAVLQVNASGQATVDDQARPAGFSGSWVGQLSVGSSSASIGGSAETPDAVY